MPDRILIATALFIALAVFLIPPVPAAGSACSLSADSIPQGADVFIDSIGSGISPLADVPVSCENHTLVMRLKGYSEFTATVSYADERHRVIIANLQRIPDKGQAIIRSEPSGGDLFIDGNTRGVTPCTVNNLERGRHEILITKAGYEPYHGVISIVPDTLTDNTEYLVPLPVTGFLGVTSSPEGADILIDGIPTGKTPVNLQRMGAGNHTVAMYKSGYWNFSGIVNVRGGDSVIANADLYPVPATCSLYIDSSPPGQGIYLNETFKGATPATLDTIPAGDYLLRMFRPENGALVNQSLTCRPGSFYEILVDLTHKDQGTVTDREWQYQNSTRMANQPGWVTMNTTHVIEKTYSWSAKGHETTVTLDIPRDLYEYYKNQPHPENVSQDISRDLLSGYAISQRDRQYLHGLVEKLRDASNSKSYGARNDYHNVVAFVQTFAYEHDIDPGTENLTEYWKYPVETLAEGTGDCEDTAILTAALLKEMGYTVAMVFPPGHAAVAVACDNCNGYYFPLNGTRYYYLETTGSGFPLGMMSKEYVNETVSVIPL